MKAWVLATALTCTLAVAQPTPLMQLQARARQALLAGDWPQAAQLWQSVCQLQEQALAALDPSMVEVRAARTFALGVAYNNLGLALARQGQHPQALAHYTHALQLMVPQLGDAPQQLNRAATLNNLGATQSALGRSAEAVASFSQAYVLRLQQLGADAEPTLLSQHNLALAQQQAGQAKACHTLQAALAGRMRTLGAMHPDTQVSQAAWNALQPCPEQP